MKINAYSFIAKNFLLNMFGHNRHISEHIMFGHIVAFQPLVFKREVSMSSPFASTVVDSVLFRDSFGTPRMRELFSDRALIQRYIDAEIALAKAEARVGVIPADAAAVIARESKIERIDFDHMRHET